MHYAKLKNSARLQRLHRYLSDGQPHSTYDIIRHTGICAVNSAAAELRCNGIPVDPAKCIGTTTNGERIYTYQLNQ